MKNKDVLGCEQLVQNVGPLYYDVVEQTRVT